MAKNANTFYKNGKKYNCEKNGVPYYRTTVMLKGKQHDVYGDGEKDAKKKADEMKAQSALGYDYDKSKAKVGTVLHYWLFNVKRVDKSIKASSFARYECAVRIHVMPYPIATMPLSKLDSATMQEYVTSLYEEHGVSGPSIHATMKVWRMFLPWAVDEGYLTKNPARNISLPGKRETGKKIETFTADERARLLSYMRESHYQYDTVIKLAFATGMREGELLSLKWDDINIPRRIISVNRSTAMVTHIDKEGERVRSREVWDTKTTNSVRDIPIRDEVAHMLEHHSIAQALYFRGIGQDVPEYVFTTDTGKLIDPSSFVKSYKRLLERADIPYRKFHAVRHTFATEAIRAGVDVKDLQMLMGHADITTTYIYVQPSEDSKRNAIEKMGALM